MSESSYVKHVKIPIIVVIFMFCMAYISVPIYNIFCKVTGFGGTTQEALECPEVQGKRNMTIRFNSDIRVDKLRWKFKPEQKSIDVKPGQCAVAWYSAENMSDVPLKGMAIYNVTPVKAGKYFYKVDCFCFREQLLAANQKVSMPVLFYIDPEIENDPGMHDVDTMTLSYTFYPFKKSFYDNFVDNLSSNNSQPHLKNLR